MNMMQLKYVPVGFFFKEKRRGGGGGKVKNRQSHSRYCPSQFESNTNEIESEMAMREARTKHWQIAMKLIEQKEKAKCGLEPHGRHSSSSFYGEQLFFFF